MLKRFLSLMLAAAVVSQGIARAEEPAGQHVSVVPDRAALAAHIDAMEEGDHVAVATAEGVVSGELVDKDADDVVIDQPLVQGGAERITIPRREIQSIHYQTGRAQRRERVGKIVEIAALVGVALCFLVTWASHLR